MHLSAILLGGIILRPEPRSPVPTHKDYDEGLQREAGSASGDDIDTTLIIRTAEG